MTLATTCRQGSRLRPSGPVRLPSEEQQRDGDVVHDPERPGSPRAPIAHDLRATKEQREPAASGGDHNQPSVKTKEEIDVEARQLNVRQVRDVAGSCAG